MCVCVCVGVCLCVCVCVCECVCNPSRTHNQLRTIAVRKPNEKSNSEQWERLRNRQDQRSCQIKETKHEPFPTVPTLGSEETTCQLLPSGPQSLVVLTKTYYAAFKIFITIVFQEHIPGGLSFTADLPGRDYNFPEHICPSSDLRPHIMVWS